MEQRDFMFLCSEEDPTTFEQDHLAPALPLPTLDDTMERYYQSLKPFGSESELKRSREIIEAFKAVEGRTLQEILEKKAKSEKNWVSLHFYNFSNYAV
ncbi:hypothetical protein DMENIID0001_104260 [Sergentomyia squamirostris]